jgi:5-hydroxyisourate hydrolase
MSSVTITTHVLDVASGTPAEGVEVELTGPGGLVAAWRTGGDGRAGPGVAEEGSAWHELSFGVGDYFARAGRECFYDVVNVRFRPGEGHCHVPLLVSAWSYSTYKGA